MADLNAQHIPERLLQAAVTKGVSEKLGTLGREIGDFMKGMSEEDAKAAKLLILEMMRNAFGEFYAKMQKRIENNTKSDE
jgi:hypothetical protein